GVGAAVQVRAEARATSEVEGEVVFRGEPARLYVKAEMTAAADEVLAVVGAVGEAEVGPQHGRQIKMAPGLRDVQRRGQRRSDLLRGVDVVERPKRGTAHLAETGRHAGARHAGVGAADAVPGEHLNFRVFRR